MRSITRRDGTRDHLGIGTYSEKGVFCNIAAVRQGSNAVALCFDIPRSARILTDHCDPNPARGLILCQKLINECANVAVQNGTIDATSQGMQDDGEKSRQEKKRMHECLGPEGFGNRAFIVMACSGANNYLEPLRIFMSVEAA